MKKTIADEDIVGYGDCAVTSTGGMHVFIRSDSPSYKRIKQAMEEGRALWDGKKYRETIPGATDPDGVRVTDAVS